MSKNIELNSTPEYSYLDINNLEMPTKQTLKEKLAVLTVAGVSGITLAILGIVTLKEILSH